nr:immunoglobulin light chain junction region [Macaca mulatta]MOX48409.1 immunoglobulin light chain junction region [Macaca mulatta]MOX48623.1 immunoglobulin light chain junction region [Macaca mulatta]MOX48949.1 immunoglobulin light chain junction region [Macaca mulatta]MOX49129.1 immunoglobulin light chain junction region [Macaca mulatta]
CQQHKNYPVTF